MSYKPKQASFLGFAMLNITCNNVRKIYIIKYESKDSSKINSAAGQTLTIFCNTNEVSQLSFLNYWQPLVISHFKLFSLFKGHKIRIVYLCYIIANIQSQTPRLFDSHDLEERDKEVY